MIELEFDLGSTKSVLCPSHTPLPVAHAVIRNPEEEPGQCNQALLHNCTEGMPDG